MSGTELAYGLRACYGMSGTELVYGLRTCYGMSGSDPFYGATRELEPKWVVGHDWGDTAQDIVGCLETFGDVSRRLCEIWGHLEIFGGDVEAFWGYLVAFYSDGVTF
eukprot:2603369-Rhodomonas_salina.1